MAGPPCLSPSRLQGRQSRGRRCCQDVNKKNNPLPHPQLRPNPSPSPAQQHVRPPAGGAGMCPLKGQIFIFGEKLVKFSVCVFRLCSTFRQMDSGAFCHQRRCYIVRSQRALISDIFCWCSVLHLRAGQGCARTQTHTHAYS